MRVVAPKTKAPYVSDITVRQAQQVRSETDAVQNEANVVMQDLRQCIQQAQNKADVADLRQCVTDAAMQDLKQCV